MTLAVSGGADSVAMLLVFNELKEILDLHINVVHVEHGIRGVTSLRDAQFVNNLCNSLGVPVKISSVKALEYAKENGLSVEESARMLRYNSLKTYGYNIIATAHNANDNAETLLFNLIRGTGVAGLTGIPGKVYRDDMTIVRPLICVNRQEIEGYLYDRGQDFCTDETNKEDIYARNRLRLNIIPQLEEINSRAIAHINDASSYLSELYSYALGEANKILRDACKGDSLDISVIKNTPLELRKIVLMTWLSKKTKGSHNVTARHISSLVEMTTDIGNKSLDLPGYRIEKEYNYLKVIDRKRPAKVQRVKDEIEIEIEKSKILSDVGMEVSIEGHIFLLRVIDYDHSSLIPSEIYTKWIDYDKISDIFSLRKKRSGDYFTINSKMSKKQYNRFCIDEKIPPSERGEKLLFCDGNHIMWMPGHRISEYYKVWEGTKRILEISRR